jgi:hypothetical protein
MVDLNSKQLCFAACRDDEKSADTFSGGVAVGAMSHVRLFCCLFAVSACALRGVTIPSLFTLFQSFARLL